MGGSGWSARGRDVEVEYQFDDMLRCICRVATTGSPGSIQYQIADDTERRRAIRTQTMSNVKRESQRRCPYSSVRSKEKEK